MTSRSVGTALSSEWPDIFPSDNRTKVLRERDSEDCPGGRERLCTERKRVHCHHADVADDEHPPDVRSHSRTIDDVLDEGEDAPVLAEVEGEFEIGVGGQQRDNARDEIRYLDGVPGLVIATPSTA